MLAAKLDRKALVVNLGGGVIGDMGGFCAATWKRGVDFIQVPTTLLSMTDAAIGGKTGIDFQGIKNTIGVFQQPVAVFVDPVFLQTLPGRELRSGYAEVIKHALIGDPELARQSFRSRFTSKIITFGNFGSKLARHPPKIHCRKSARSAGRPPGKRLTNAPEFRPQHRPRAGKFVAGNGGAAHTWRGSLYRNGLRELPCRK